jgi:hypothetical protein
VNAKLLAGGLVNVLLVDGDHSYAGVCADVASYLQFVAADGLVVLHDICQRLGQPEVAVHKYWQGRRTASIREAGFRGVGVGRPVAQRREDEGPVGDDLRPPVRQGAAVDRDKTVGGYRHLPASCWYP